MQKCERIACAEIEGTNCYCDPAAEEEIRKRILETGTAPGGIRFLGSGNYHYVSFLTTALIREPYTLVMIDHHPDLRRPAFGDILHCGGWLRDVIIKQPLLKKVVLIGVSEALWEEEYEALLADGDVPQALLAKLCAVPGEAPLTRVQTERLLPADLPVFFSVDKDVLSVNEVKTNWDQGGMTLDALCGLLGTAASLRRVIGADICGDVDEREADNAFAPACGFAGGAGEETMRARSLAVDARLAGVLLPYL